MALPKRYDGLEDGLTIAAEIVSACTGVPVIGTATTVAIKKLIEEFLSPTLKLKDVLNKKIIKALNIPDGKFDFIFEQTRIALRSINSEDYNSSLFKQHVFTRNCFNPVTISDEIIGSLELGEEEKSEVLKAVRFVLAVYLLRWTEEPDFSLETRQKLQHVESTLEKVDLKVETLDKKTMVRIANYEDRINKLENCATPIPVELTIIPKSITNLIGRESVIQEITAKLETDHVLFLTADGGMGKTAIAKNIINRIRKDIGKDGFTYKHVAWLTSSGNLKEDLLQINISDFAAGNQEAKHIKVCRFLQSNPTFLVIDNMDEMLTPDDIDILNTLSGSSTILITSRATSDTFPSYELSSLDRNTAVVLFYNHFSHDSAITTITHNKIKEEIATGRIEDAYRIVDATGRNPLVIELIAKTAYAENFKTYELWEKISSGIFGFESKTEVHTDHSGKYPESKLSIDEQMRRLYSMLKLTDKRKEIMSFISLFPAEHDIFSDVFKWAGFFVLGANDMMYLVDSGWIIREDDYYSIHTIVRDSINMQNKKAGSGVSILDYVKLIEKLSDIDSYIPKTMDYNLAQKMAFVPQTVGKLLRKNYTFNTTIGKFFNNLAGLYMYQGNYDEALKYYRMSIEIFEKVFGTDYIGLATIYNNIAVLYIELSNYYEALKCLRTALDIHEKTIGIDPSSIATTFNNIAQIKKELGYYDEALGIFKMALEISEKAFGKDHPNTATIYSNMASLYEILDNYDEALEYYKKDLEICEKILGKNHPSTATSYNNIAGLYLAQGNYNEALKFYKMALKIREKTFGKDHPSTAITYYNIASVYHKHGNFDAALKYYKLSLEIKEKTLDKDHTSIANTYNSIASIYQYQGKYAEALKLFEFSLEINKKTFGIDHPNTATIYNNIALLYRAQGNYDEALKYFNIALEIKKKTLGNNHHSTATAYNNIAATYANQGNYDNAIDYFKISLEIYEKTLGKDHPSTANAYDNIASAYQHQGNYDEALKYYIKALEIYEKKLGKNHPDTITLYYSLADLYTIRGNCDKALEYYKILLEIYERTLGKDHPSTFTIYNIIIQLYQEQGNSEETMKYYKKLLKILEETLGKDDPLVAATYNNIASLYQDQGNFEEALKNYLIAIDIDKKTLADNYPNIAITYNNIANLYQDQGKFDEAMQYYIMSLDIYKKELDKDDPYVAATYNNIASLYQEQGNYNEALKYYKLALEIREKTLGIHPDTAITYEKLAELYCIMGIDEESKKCRTRAEEIKQKLKDE